MTEKTTQSNPTLVVGSLLHNNQLLYFTSTSLSADDKYLYFISDCDGNPNIYVKDLERDTITKLTNNKEGMLKSYVYFGGTKNKGLGKASLSLDFSNNIIYFLQGCDICKVGLDGVIHKIAETPENQVTGFTHISVDGKYFCVSTTDERALEFDPKTGHGPDTKPPYDIDLRVREEHLSSYLRVYDTTTGEMTICEEVPDCWITHVSFNPVDTNLIMYNHEWPSDCVGFRRMWLFDAKNGKHTRLRNEGEGRSITDWACHEMWSADGQSIIYHGGYKKTQDSFIGYVGKVEMSDLSIIEIPFPKEYVKYGHFTISHTGLLCCDGYYTDETANVHVEGAEFITTIECDWENEKISWKKLSKHSTEWHSQDSHPHPIFNHKGDKVFFSARHHEKVGIYYLDVE